MAAAGAETRALQRTHAAVGTGDRLGYLCFRPDSLAYTIGRALVQGGHTVSVWWSARRREGEQRSAFAAKLASTPGISLEEQCEPALSQGLDRLFLVSSPQLLRQPGDLDALAERARRITLVSAGDGSMSWADALRQQWRELRRLRPWMGKVDRVLYKDGFHPVDLYAALKPRRVIGFDVHSQFLHDPRCYADIHAGAWDAETERPILVNFLGSQDPDSRKRILDTMRPFFSVDAPQGKRRFWHEYSDAQKGGGLSAAEFLEVLRGSDFTLCPPGYSLVTHRPMEALLCGSIPVLHAAEMALYDIGLADGVNCVAVAPGRWAATLERLAGLPQAQVRRMRQNVRPMLDRLLAYEPSSRRMRARLGLTG